MERFICTFGANQKNEGKYILMLAKSRDKAIDKMYELYGNEWCHCYTEKQWNEAPDYIKKETLLTTIEAGED